MKKNSIFSDASVMNIPSLTVFICACGRLMADMIVFIAEFTYLVVPAAKKRNQYNPIAA